MAREYAAALGSGTVPYLDPILHTSLGGTADTLPVGAGPGQGRGQRGGAQVVVANPEDINSAPAFLASGVTVGTSAPVQVWAPDLHEPLLRRRRSIVIQNLGANPVFIGHNSEVSATLGSSSPGFRLDDLDANNGNTRVELPLMGGVSVWAIASGGASEVRVLVY